MSAPGSVDVLAYCCYVLLGTGALLSWNSLVTAADYWESRYPGKHTDRLVAISYMPVSLVMTSIMVHFHGRVRPSLRIIGGLLGFTAAISAVPVLDLATPTTGTLALLLLLVAVCGACDGLTQGALFGDAALLPPPYRQALVSGTAVSGVVVCLLRVVTKATLPDTPAGLRASANLYFCITALVCATCTFVYSYVLPHLPAIQQARQAALEAALHCDAGDAHAEVTYTPPKHLLPSPHRHRQQQQQQHKAQQQRPRSRQSIDLELPFEDQTHIGAHHLLPAGQRLAAAAQLPQQDQQNEGDQAALQEALLQGQHVSVGDGDGGSGRKAGILTSGAVFRVIWRLAVSNTLIYTVTLSIFPGMLAEDEHSAELGSWYPVALITAFNLADCVGKSLPGWRALRLRNEHLILAATCLRVFFVPAFHYATVMSLGPAAIALLTLLLGTSNGYLTSVAMIEGPAAVPTAAAPLAGNQMVLFLILGLCIGSACSFLWLL